MFLQQYFSSVSGVGYNSKTDELWTPVLARHVRIVVLESSGNACLRMAIYGCKPECRRPLGVSTFDVEDNQMSSQSEWPSGSFSPSRGRLNQFRGMYHDGTAVRNELYLEIDFLKDNYITGAAMQGAQSSWPTYWVTSFSVAYQPADETQPWRLAKLSNGDTTFPGNINYHDPIRFALL